jgi:outer membrane protein assembly factor BamB
MPRHTRFPRVPIVFAATCAAAAAVAGLTSARAADWPQWRGPHRDGHAAAGEVAVGKLAADPTVAWKREVGFGVDSPVVAGGVVYYLDEAGGKETVHAADAKTGKAVWSAVLDDTFKDKQSQPGPRCTATVDGNRVYAQSCRGTLKCLRAADGNEVWSANYGKAFGAVFIGELGKAEGAVRHGYAGAPLVDGDRLIVGVAGKEAAYAGFDKRTGKELWRTALEGLSTAYAAPTLATIGGVRQVVAFATAAVVGLDPATGKLLWRSPPVKTALGRHITTPVVVGDLVVVGSFQAGLIGFRVAKAGDGFKAEQAWATKDAMPNFSGLVAIGGEAVNGGSGGGTAGATAVAGLPTHVVGVGQGLKLFCIEIATGKLAWSQDAGLGKSHAGLIVVGDTVLALGDAGELVAFAADPTAYKEMGRAKACDKNWCTPAYVDGKLYLRDARELRCLNLGR